jgi:hypothetical protein
MLVLVILCSLAFNCKADGTNQVSNQEPHVTMNFVGVPISDVLRIYVETAGVELKFNQQLPWAATNSTINFQTAQPLTRAETIQALKKVFREQAGVVLKPLDAKHVEVTYDQSVKAKN